MPNGQKRKPSYRARLSKLALISPSAVRIVAWTGYLGIPFDVIVLRLFFDTLGSNQERSAKWNKLRRAAVDIVGSKYSTSFDFNADAEAIKLEKAYHEGVRL